MGNKAYFIILSLIGTFTLQLIALWPSFNLALFGDDWLAFWRTWINSDPSLPNLTGGYLNPVRYFLTPYGPQDMNMGLLRHFFGFNSLPYYIVSFIWRLSVAYALFFVVLKFTDNKLAAFFAGTFFAVSSIGLETTNWVFNMTSYTGLFFLIFFIYFYFYSRQIKSYKMVFIAFIILFLAIVTVPIRMHGVLIVIIFSEILWLVLDRTKRNLKYTVFRIAVFLFTLLTIKTVGTSFADPNETITRTKTGFTLLATYLKQGHLEVLLSPIMSFGNMIFPDDLWSKVTLSQNLFLTLSLLIFVAFILKLFILTPKEKRTNSYIYKLAVIGLVFNFIIWLIYKNDMQYFSSVTSIGSVLIGGYTLILLINMVISGFFGKKYSVFSAAVILWPHAFLMLPWITLNAGAVFSAPHRYVITSSAGIALIWALLAVLKINKKVLISLFILNIIIQIYATNNYLNILAQKRSREISKKIWSVLERDLPQFDTKKIYVVLFASDATNGGIVYDSVFFGFPPRMAVRDKIWDSNRTPIGVTGYEEVISAVTDGKMFRAHGHVEKPISPAQILAFSIVGETVDQIEVRNITDQVQKDLKKRSEEYLKTHPGLTYQE